MSGGAAEGVGDVVVAGEAMAADGEVAQGSHDCRAAACRAHHLAGRVERCQQMHGRPPRTAGSLAVDRDHPHPTGRVRGRRVAGQDDNTVVPAHYLIDGVSPSRAAARDLADAWVDPD